MNVLVLAFCIVLCGINAALWTLYTDMPLAGAAWIGAAALVIWLRKWSWN